VLPTVLAFNYVCQDKISKVPCSTALDDFSFVNHCTVLVAGTVVPFYSAVANVGDHEGRAILGTQMFMSVEVEGEQVGGAVMFVSWLAWNVFFWVHEPPKGDGRAAEHRTYSSSSSF
jgi:hypothetical protein